ncbi:hypothetical protein [Aquimarina longa]|uniref:hypothetical protein n=1 Tax=Aquimarina longa TaxID=1080221 RepID=UPI000785B346|nr:hypothetical protein [Aquimarina longa]
MIKTILLLLLGLFFFSFNGIAQEKVLWEKNNEIPVLETDSKDNWVNLLTYKKSFSKYRENWSVTYTGFEDIDDDLIIPFTLSYGHNKIRKELLGKLGYKSVETFALGFGMNGYLKMYPGIYLGVGVGLSPGMESTTRINNDKNRYFFIGADFKQGLRFIPWHEFGIVIGVEFFQKLQTSKVYSSEIGWSIEVGVNF